jgi:hypothetical protein
VLFAAGAVGAGAAPFLSPVMGQGALDAPGLNGPSKNGVGEQPSGNATFVPGNNQAGAHANENAFNDFGGPSDNTPDGGYNVPGTPGFTPLWNL